MKPPRKQRLPGSPEDWLAHAGSDLSLARMARGHAEVLPEQVCFHAQQAAEKALKAVFLARNIGFARTHDLEALLELARQSGIPTPATFAELGSLTPYAVESRYPGSWDEITLSDVEDAIRLAEQTLAWASRLLAGDESSA